MPMCSNLGSRLRGSSSSQPCAVRPGRWAVELPQWSVPPADARAAPLATELELADTATCMDMDMMSLTSACNPIEKGGHVPPPTPVGPSPQTQTRGQSNRASARETIRGSTCI
eukprot:scaffold5365_cov115-Isochrysis_galbana.AAC.4